MWKRFKLPFVPGIRFCLVVLLLSLCLVGREAKLDASKENASDFATDAGKSRSASKREVERGASNQEETSPAVFPQVGSAAFSGSDSAWLVTRKRGYLLRTVDGGASWQEVPAKPINKSARISFIDSQRGWVVNDAGGQGQVWHSTDGGRKWSALGKLKSDNSEWHFNSARQIDFVDELHGWLIETSSIWRTHDAGVSWRQVLSASDSRLRGQPARGFFISALKGWVCGTDGDVYDTADGGKTWRIQIVEKNANFSDVFFVNENTGWLTRSSQGQLYTTDDGGVTWHLQPKLTVNQYSDIESCYFVSKKEGWAVGRRLLGRSTGLPASDMINNLIRGIVLHTLDGGESWQSIQPGENEPFFNGVYFTDTQHGWLFSRDNVYRTIDAGKTWRIVLKLPPLKASD